MNVEVDNLPNCITTLRVEVPQAKVTEAWSKVTQEYLKHARLPGYRPGKAPRNVVAAKYKKEIRDEVEKALLSESYREVIAEKQIRVLQLTGIDDLEVDEKNGMHFTATVVTAPEFELPDYKNIKVEEKPVEVTDAEIDEALDAIRKQHADFNDIEGRPLQMDDFAVIDYRGTIDGKPVDEVVPGASKPLAQNDDFWLKLTPQSFFPGFAEQILGAAPGDTRSFDLEIPQDFPLKELAGQKVHYEVTIKAAKEQVLPELNDEFAASVVPEKTVADLRELTRAELTHEKEREASEEKKNAIMRQLLSHVECELPENMVKYETRRIMADIVRENQTRGISDDTLKENEKDIVENAGRGARDRLKGTFILVRIAEAEGISVSREEVQQRVAMLAMRYRTTPEKMMKELRERNALESVHEEILTGKVLDFLASGDSVQNTSPATV